MPEQVVLMSRFFPACCGNPRMNDLRVLSGIISGQMTGWRWRDTPEEYDSSKTLYSRFNRWGGKGIFREMLSVAPRTRIQGFPTPSLAAGIIPHSREKLFKAADKQSKLLNIARPAIPVVSQQDAEGLPSGHIAAPLVFPLSSLQKRDRLALLGFRISLC